MIIIDHSTIKAKNLFKGPVVNGCNEDVELRPMLVMKTEDIFPADIPSKVGRKGHYNEQHDWLDEGLVVLNGEVGKGVDVFFALKKPAGGYIVFIDQCKRVGGIILTVQLSKI